MDDIWAIVYDKELELESVWGEDKDRKNEEEVVQRKSDIVDIVLQGDSAKDILPFLKPTDRGNTSHAYPPL